MPDCSLLGGHLKSDSSSGGKPLAKSQSPPVCPCFKSRPEARIGVGVGVEEW
jgi:hypothetical protein